MSRQLLVKVSFVLLALRPWGYPHCSFCSCLSILFWPKFLFFFSLLYLPIIFVLETNWKNISVLFLDTFSFLINKCQQPGAYEQPYSNKRMYTAGNTQFAKEKQINISGFWGLFVNNRTFKNINLTVIAFISAFLADSLADSLNIMKRSSYWKSF